MAYDCSILFSPLAVIAHTPRAVVETHLNSTCPQLATRCTSNQIRRWNKSHHSIYTCFCAVDTGAIEAKVAFTDEAPIGVCTGSVFVARTLTFTTLINICAVMVIVIQHVSLPAVTEVARVLGTCRYHILADMFTVPIVQ
jgi:hypothetical protein